jgi:hypothetical protein
MNWFSKRLISPIILVIFSLSLIGLGLKRGSTLILIAGGISLAAALGALRFQWRVQGNDLVQAELLKCPQCGRVDALQLETLSMATTGKLAVSEACEHCPNCGYRSTSFALTYPLEPEIAGLLGIEKQADVIATRRANEAWMRMKQR